VLWWWLGRKEGGGRTEQRKDDLNEVTVGTLGGPCVVPTLESERFEARKVRRRPQIRLAQFTTPSHSFCHLYDSYGQYL